MELSLYSIAGENIRKNDHIYKKVGSDPTNGHQYPWFKIGESDDANSKLLRVANRDYTIGELVDFKDVHVELKTNNTIIPIIDESQICNDLNIVRSSLLSIATLIEGGCFYRAYHEILMLEKLVSGVQSIK